MFGCARGGWQMSKQIQQPLAQPLKLGVIGGGVNSAVGYAHYVAAQLDNKWQIISGFFSRDPETNRQTAEAWHIPNFAQYDSWQTYIQAEKQNLDAVVVLSPTPKHAEMVCYLIEQGIPVICEKAMTANTNDSLKIKHALDQFGGFLAITFNYSGYSMVRELKKRIQDGELGKLLQIQIEMPSDAFINQMAQGKPQDWRLADGEIPTILLDLAVHLHHLIGFVSEKIPQKVMADFHHFSKFDGIIDDAYIWGNYSDDMKASIWLSKTAYGYKNGLNIRVFGDQGSAQWYQETPDILKITNRESVEMQYNRGNALNQDSIVERFKPGHPTGFVEAFANLYSDIADNLCRYQSQPEKFEFDEQVFGWDHAHEGLMMLKKATESSKKGCWVQVD